MEHIKQKSASPEEIISALRSLIEASGGNRVRLRRFIHASGIRAEDIFLHYSCWEEVVEAAGFKFKPWNRFVGAEKLLQDWGILTRKLQRLPIKSEYQTRGRYASETFANHFGEWSFVPIAFLRFAKEKPEWADVAALVTQLVEQRGRKSKITCSSTGRPKRRRPSMCSRSLSAKDRKNRGLPVYGDPLEFGAMRNAPVNEAGVMFLFALMAERLGFMIELVRSKFPDCEARRKIGVNEWRTVRIEFEYESGNFRHHRHDPKGCDLIVCWEDNWDECPVEVLALRDEIAGMDAKPGISGACSRA
ncbi:MAG TPA: hypothetical protein VG733_08140 [Chthoniobacteraceae bacterium]|nr:hypothetical protein [Chthoniobacteraceae bacterium]